MEEAEISDNKTIPKEDDLPNSQAKSCALCGCSTPAVRCDRCSSQVFCLSCDDMYHRHPKRKQHLRKAVDSIWNSAKSPRFRRRTELPGDPSKIPIPPPRTKKRSRHTIGGRVLLKPPHELGSFGRSKVFDLRNLSPMSNDVFAGRKTPNKMEQTYENDADMSLPEIPIKRDDIYENENIPINQDLGSSSFTEKTPWNLPRTNMSSPIQVSIPSNSPEMMTNGQSFGYPLKAHSRSITDLTAAPPPNAIGPHPYQIPHYPYMHPPMQPPYSHSMAHLNCAQCLSASWSNLMSPHPSPFFHPVPWGSAHGTLARGQMPPGQLKHSHGNIPAYPDANFNFLYPGGPFNPVMDQNAVKDFYTPAADMPTQKGKRSRSGSRHTHSSENVEAAAAEEQHSVKSEEGASNKSKPDIDDLVPQIPAPPKQPWSCMHCTFINPPGNHICQVCCKTSYGTNTPTQPENQSEARSLDSRNSDSSMELVNLDAISQSPDFTKHRVQKVI